MNWAVQLFLHGWKIGRKLLHMASIALRMPMWQSYYAHTGQYYTWFSPYGLMTGVSMSKRTNALWTRERFLMVPNSPIATAIQTATRNWSQAVTKSAWRLQALANYACVFLWILYSPHTFGNSVFTFRLFSLLMILQHNTCQTKLCAKLCTIIPLLATTSKREERIESYNA